MNKVYLVGAGCGDLELYTIKALKCIKKADCIIYDHLVDHRILDNCKNDCEKIYVGKISHNHALPQNEINELLVSKAKQYYNVVRLKGGDVYVFGRGGEEAEFLYNHGIDFEVVPGISSSIGGLAYAGIPVTHRGLSGGFQVYTGALRQDEDRLFDFKTMLDDYTTYIFLMSMKRKEKIIQGLLDAGKNPETPVCIVSKATLPTQQKIVGTLSTILELFNKNPVENPGVIVVGNVVKMNDILDFYQRKPLFGKKILITTMKHDHYLKDKLHEYGCYTHEIATGKICYLDADIPKLDGYLVFTSKHGVIGFMKNFFKQYHDVRALSHVNIVTIGKKTDEILHNYGLSSDYIPTKSNHIALNQELRDLIKDEDVYVVQGDSTYINVKHHTIQVYTNQIIDIEDLNEHYDYALFTCGSSVKRIVENTHVSFNHCISLGPSTTKYIRYYYPDIDIIEVEKATKDMMIEAVLKEEEYVL